MSQKRPATDLISLAKTRRVPGPQSPVARGPLPYEPDEAPGERFRERAIGELVPFRTIQRHDPSGMVDGPGAGAAAMATRRAQGILQGAATS